MSLTDAELRQLRDLLIKPFETLDQRRYFLSLAFPSELNRRSTVSLEGESREFAWRLVNHYYHNDRNALLTVLNVIQDEQGGNLARALQPFVEKLTLTNVRYKIFVSYRRKGGYFMHSVVRDLRARMPSYEFFIDFASIDSADFGEAIHRHLEQSDCFLLLLTEHTLDPERLFKPDDWIRYEVRLALERGVPIIQVADESTSFARKDQLPEDIQALAEREGRRIQLDLWDATLQRLIDFIPQAIANPPQPIPATLATKQRSSEGVSLSNYQSLLERAVELSERDDYEAALPLLEQLKAAGYRIKVVEPLLEVARRRLSLRKAYEDIALLARSRATLKNAWSEWLIFQKEYPDWYSLNRDTENLLQQFLEAFRALRTFIGHVKGVTSVTWSPDGRFVASGSKDNSIRLWNAESGQPLQPLMGHSDYILSLSWSPNGVNLVSGSKDKTVRLWNVQTGQLFLKLTGHSGYVLSVSWSPNAPAVASSSEDKSICLWNAQSGRRLRIFTGHINSVLSIAWSPDGRFIASGSNDKTIRLWDIQNGQLLRNLVIHTGSVNSVTWSLNGRFIASSSDDKTICIWDSQNGQPLRTLTGHEDWIGSVAWSPDSSVIASGSGDRTVRLWDAQTGQLLHILKGHTDAVLSVAWSPDGRYLASGSADGTVIIWGIP